MENFKELNSAIIKTIVHFDLFDYPLTDFELWQFLSIKTSYLEVKNSLNISNLSSADGFLFLQNRAEIIKIRQQRYRQGLAKINLAKKRLKLFTWLPGIKLICLANIIGPNNIKPKSDIDLFIITKANRVWLVKFLATIILKIFNLRPTDKNVTNKLCLSFLIDETALDLSPYRQGENDWYFTYWLVGLMPLWGEIKTYENLMAANSWINQVLPNWQIIHKNPLKIFTEKKISNKLSILGNYFEKLSHQLHASLMNQSFKAAQVKNNNVVINDHVLKLHTTDKREHFFNLANEKINQLTN